MIDGIFEGLKVVGMKCLVERGKARWMVSGWGEGTDGEVEFFFYGQEFSRFLLLFAEAAPAAVSELNCCPRTRENTST